jgi:ribose 5-phosphate isomerase A
MPGVVEHGIFADIVKAVFIGSSDGVKLLQR